MLSRLLDYSYLTISPCCFCSCEINHLRVWGWLCFRHPRVACIPGCRYRSLRRGNDRHMVSKVHFLGETCAPASGAYILVIGSDARRHTRCKRRSSVRYHSYCRCSSIRTGNVLSISRETVCGVLAPDVLQAAPFQELTHDLPI
jgi:hypothetical protein